MKLIKWDEVLMNYFANVGVANKCSLAEAAEGVKAFIREGSVLVVFPDGREDKITLERGCDYKDLAAIKSSIANIRNVFLKDK